MIMTRQRWWMLAGVAALLVVVGVGSFLFSGVRGLMISKAESYALIIPVEKLRDFGISSECGEACARFDHSLRSGTLEISYEYDSSAHPDADGAALYVSSVAQVNLTSLNAWQDYWAYIGALRVGFLNADEKLTVEPVEHGLDLGDQHYWARLRNRHGIVGDMVVIRQGRTVLAYVISGVHFETKGDLEDLLRPVVEKAAALQEKA